MNRLSSQILFCSPKDIRRNTMIELDDHNRVLQMLDIDVLQSETAHTLFFNGIISASIVSLQKHIDTKSIIQNSDKYFYINLLTDFSVPNLGLEKRILIIDAETEDPQVFSRTLQANFEKLSQISIFEIISAATYNPALVTGFKNEISIQSTIKPMLWQHCNMIEKLLTKNIEVINIIK